MRTHVPTVLVVVLRETSVLFGSLIAMIILKEVMIGWRVLASSFAVLGTGLLTIDDGDPVKPARHGTERAIRA